MWTHLDWNQSTQEAIEDLQALLRIDSSNPPGNETLAAAFVAERLRDVGLEPTVLESAPDRANVIARIEGSEDLAPVLLSAHLDVVPAVGDWTHPPFGGEIHDGYLWGRGAIDMKQTVIMNLWMMRQLAKLDTPPKRTVIFAAVADEEQGCHYGSHWIVDNHPELVRAGYMISEVGGFSLYIRGKCFYPIQVAEKGRVLMKMTTRGPAGHASLHKRERTAILKLSEALAKLSTTPLPRHVTLAERDFITQVAAQLSLPFRQIFPLLLGPLGDRLLSILPAAQAEPLFAALHNTVSATILESGNARNVHPEEAVALLDGRTLPGQTAADLLRELRAVVGSEPELEIEDERPPVWMDDYDTDLYKIMCDSLRQHDPQGTPVPYLMNGFTDAKAWHRLGMRCYGFSPLKLPPDLPFSSLFHAPDERIPLDGFRWGLKVFADVIGRFVGVQGS